MCIRDSFHAREKNAGWRIDYFIVSNRIADQVTAAEIHNEVFGLSLIHISTRRPMAASR